MNTLSPHTRFVVALSLLALFCSSACMRSSERVASEAALGSYHVSIRPTCQNISTRSLRRYQEDGSSRIGDYELRCGDTTVAINGSTLSVNDKSYGTLSEGDRIAIDFGKVRVNSEVREEAR